MALSCSPPTGEVWQQVSRERRGVSLGTKDTVCSVRVYYTVAARWEVLADEDFLEESA